MNTYIPKWTTLRTAINYVRRATGLAYEDAQELLLTALRDENIKARGLRTWKPVPADYFREPAINPVHLFYSDYTEIEVCFADLQRILEPGGHEDQLRRMVHEAITAVYDEARAFGEAPPNIKQIIAPVQARLRALGHRQSGRQIQKLAEAPQHKARRRKPGATIASEGRPKKA